MLNDILTPTIRRVIYAVYAIVGLVLGAVQVGVTAVPDGAQPAWLTVALAVYAFVGTGLGFTASANTAPQLHPDTYVGVIDPDDH